MSLLLDNSCIVRENLVITWSLFKCLKDWSHITLFSTPPVPSVRQVRCIKLQIIFKVRVWTAIAVKRIRLSTFHWISSWCGTSFFRMRSMVGFKLNSKFWVIYLECIFNYEILRILSWALDESLSPTYLLKSLIHFV